MIVVETTVISEPTRFAPATAELADLVLADLITARCRVEFNDMGAMVGILRTHVWRVPGVTSRNTSIRTSRQATGREAVSP